MLLFNGDCSVASQSVKAFSYLHIHTYVGMCAYICIWLRVACLWIPRLARVFGKFNQSGSTIEYAIPFSTGFVAINSCTTATPTMPVIANKHSSVFDQLLTSVCQQAPFSCGTIYNPLPVFVRTFLQLSSFQFSIFYTRILSMRICFKQIKLHLCEKF